MTKIGYQNEIVIVFALAVASVARILPDTVVSNVSKQKVTTVTVL
jgi:hypothetical protein